MLSQSPVRGPARVSGLSEGNGVRRSLLVLVALLALLMAALVGVGSSALAQGGGAAVECSDDQDNDGDGAIDDPDDPGCEDGLEDSEGAPSPPPPSDDGGTGFSSNGSSDGGGSSGGGGGDGSSGGASGTGGPLRLEPFPIVRIRGVGLPGGARVQLLTVSGPAAASVQVRCIGRQCPVRVQAVRAALVPGAPPGMLAPGVRLVSLTSFNGRYFPAGLVIEVSVTRPGYVGKVTRFLIPSRRKAPLRTDLCLLPGARVPGTCPP
jgi:hypothetical protein